MRYVIAGLGSIGRRHLKNLLALGENDIILLRKNLSSLPDDELRDFPVVTSLQAALERKPDAVIIANPTALHLEIAVPAARAGCQILIEKPIAHSLAGIDQLQAALQTGKGRLLVGFQYRFHPTLKIARRLIVEGEIGRPVSVQSHWGEYLPDWHPWEDFKNSYAARADLGGGVVLTLCHPFDYLSWLFGKPKLEWACVETRGNLGIKVEDVADVNLRFPGGALGTLHLDYLQKPAAHYLEIIGTGGTIRWDNSDGRLSIYRHKTMQWEYFMPPEEFERNAMFLEQMKHFLAVARGEAEPLCTLTDGVNALDLALQTLAFKPDKINLN